MNAKKTQWLTFWATAFTMVICMLTLAACEPNVSVEEEDTSSSELTKVVIGRGYDVTGRYAYSPEIKEAVLDHDRLWADGKILKDTNLSEGNFSTTSGSTITTYQSNLAIEAGADASGGIAGASFSAEVSTHFSSDKYTSDEYAFATSTSKITKDSYYVDGRRDPAQLAGYLTDAFIADLDSKTPEELFAKYGTDVMLGGIWGARLDYHMTAKKTTSQSGTQIGAYASARVEAAFGSAGATASVDSQYESYFDTSSVEITTRAYGGAVEYAQAVHNEGDYTAWIETIADNQVWCDYYPESLYPIYEFITDETKKAEIQAAYNTYLSGKVITVTNTEQTKTVTYSITEKGFTSRQSGGDNDMGMSSSKTADYELTVALRLDSESTNIIANITLSVAETVSNWTTFAGSVDSTIPVNKNITSIDLSPMSYTVKGSISGDVDSKSFTVSDCDFMSSYTIHIDSSNSNDQPYIGATLDLSIPIHYRP